MHWRYLFAWRGSDIKQQEVVNNLFSSILSLNIVYYFMVSVGRHEKNGSMPLWYMNNQSARAHSLTRHIHIWFLVIDYYNGTKQQTAWGIIHTAGPSFSVLKTKDPFSSVYASAVFLFCFFLCTVITFLPFTIKKTFFFFSDRYSSCVIILNIFIFLPCYNPSLTPHLVQQKQKQNKKTHKKKQNKKKQLALFCPVCH